VADQILPATIAQLADAAARLAVETHETQPNPFDEGSPDAIEFQRRYEIALLRHSQHEEGEASA
jgi:hypothetical protein